MLWKKIIWWSCCCVGVLAGCVQLPSGGCDGNNAQANQSAHASKGRCKVNVSVPDAPVMMPKRTEKPVVSISVEKSVGEVGNCLHSKLQSRFNLPPEFYKVSTYANDSLTLSLVNPFTKIEGLQLDVVKVGLGRSEINLYANGAVLSKAWKKFPELCR